MLYFDALAQDKDPGIKALQDFIRAVQQLLGDLLDGSLLEASDHDVQPPTLFMEFREEAMMVFDEHVLRSFDDLHRYIPEIRPEHIDAHGLVGAPQLFKFRVLGGIEAARKRFRLFIIKGGRRHSLDLFLRRNTFNGGNVDVPNRFYLRN